MPSSRNGAKKSAVARDLLYCVIITSGKFAVVKQMKRFHVAAPRPPAVNEWAPSKRSTAAHAYASRKVSRTRKTPNI